MIRSFCFILGVSEGTSVFGKGGGLSTAVHLAGSSTLQAISVQTAFRPCADVIWVTLRGGHACSCFAMGIYSTEAVAWTVISRGPLNPDYFPGSHGRLLAAGAAVVSVEPVS